MHDANSAIGVAGTQAHRCLKGHPLNPVSLAAWQEGFGVPASQSFAHMRKCKLCRHEIPKSHVRLGCAKGCEQSVCLNLNCALKVYNAAKNELERTRPTPARLEAVIREGESLILREVAVDSLRELGGSARFAAPALERLVLQDICHMKDALYGTSASRNCIRHTHLANDATHPLKEYQGWRSLRIKAASTLALMGEMQVLEDALFGQDPEIAGRSEVREAAIMGIAELGVMGRGADASHLAERLGQALFDEVETVRMAAAHALRSIAPAGVAEPAVQFLVEALNDQNEIVLPEREDVERKSVGSNIKKSKSFGGMPLTKWTDVEGKHLFELDVVTALSLVGTAAGSPAAESLANRLARSREKPTVRWPAADALAQSGAFEDLRKASEHQQLKGNVLGIASLDRTTRKKTQKAATVDEVRRFAQTALDRTLVK